MEEKEQLRILILEDVPTDAELMQHELRRAGIAFIAQRVDTREAYVQALEAFRPDIVLADYRLPTFDGREALHIVRHSHPEVPLIVVTGTLGDEPAIELLKAGAKDYVLKGHLARLAPSVQRALSEEQGIRARKAAEKAVREAEEKYRALFTEARDGIVLIDCESGHIIDCNPEFERLSGRKLEQLQALRVWELRPPEKVEAARKMFLKTRGTGTGGSSDLELQQPDGTTVPIEFVARVIQLKDRRYIQSISRDITERKRAEAELQQYRTHLEEMVQQRTTELSKASQRLEYLAASSPTVIYSRKVDKDYPATFVSANVRNLLGYEPRDFTEDPGFWPSHIHPEDAPRALEGLGHLAEKGRDSHEYRFRLKDGGYRWLHDELKLTYDAEGRPLEVVGYLTDITARKGVERLKDELVSTVSHELRTPLTTLRGFVELLLARDFPPEKERQILGIVDQETMRLTRLIDDFLDIQRIESGSQEYRFEGLDVLPLLRDMAELFQKSDHKHTIRVDAPAGLPCVRADGERIRQVLENLIANALKFSPAGGEILLRARAGGNEIEISVTDPGIGIPAEEIPKIFAKFYRVERPGMPRFPGTGLGLALVREIVQKHGGRVWVESELGRGSTFYFTLPVEGA